MYLKEGISFYIFTHFDYLTYKFNLMERAIIKEHGIYIMYWEDTKAVTTVM